MDFREETRYYGEVFKNCYDLLLSIHTFDSVDSEGDILALQYSIPLLEKATHSFESALYAEIKDITDLNHQNTLFCYLKDNLPLIVFENKIINSDTKQTYMNEWQDKSGGYLVVKLITALSRSLEWYDSEDIYKLKRFANTFQEKNILLNYPAEVDNSTLSDQNVVNPQTSLNREATGYLFFELQSHKVIKQNMTKKELSEYVSIITGWSAEQIRQTYTDKRKITDNTKDQLRELLDKMLKGLK